MNQADLGRGYRLRGEIAGQNLTLPLAEGKNLVGRDNTCAVVLPVTGVSRRHAVLSVDSRELTVVDADSVNGTFVNGSRVTHGSVSVGDEVRFGPVRLRVEAMDPEDAVLGLAIDMSQGGAPAADASELGRGMTTRSTLADDDPGRSQFQLIDGFLERMALHPDPDIGGALGLVSAFFEAPGCALVEWPQTGPPAVVAMCGDVAALPGGEEVRGTRCDRHQSDLRWLEGASRSSVGAVVSLAGGELLGLLLVGQPVSQLRRPLVATLVRIARTFYSSPTVAFEGTGEARSGKWVVPEGIVLGESPAMVSIYQQLRLLLQGDVSVLVLGETGVGKEHIARMLHLSTARRSQPFVAVNCAAMPPDLLEAEMFGIGRGVATGVEARRGKLQQAGEGTLFLDEIGDMPIELQAKLLRALQEKEIVPLGGAPVPLRARVITATNTDLERRIADGRFRADLFYRIAGYELKVPPLRRRPEDLQRLLGHFLHRHCREIGKSMRGVTVRALKALIAYDWPGNVRELEHEARRMAYLCPEGRVVDSDMLSPRILSGPSLAGEAESEIGDLGLQDQVDALQRRLLRQALIRTGGNQARAARLLDISRSGLIKRLKRLGVSLSSFAD